ncbi:MAG: NnrU protein [Myxococcales bacterium]|nr:MAG: NnrU protein [Myxococcales bacterium]
MEHAVHFAGLALAALTWFLLHAGVAGTGLRFALVQRFGEKTYRGGFSLASVASLWWLVQEYRQAPFVALWVTPRPLSFVPLVLVPLSFMLFVGAFTVPNPSSVGGEKLLAKAEPARGMLRITRHPFLWSVVLWALAHLLVNADAGSQIFFFSLGVTALRGAFDIDRKRRRTNPEEFARFEALTSNVPFLALAQGRSSLSPRELALPVLLGLVLAAGTIGLHGRLFGARAVPSGLVAVAE